MRPCFAVLLSRHHNSTRAPRGIVQPSGPAAAKCVLPNLPNRQHGGPATPGTATTRMHLSHYPTSAPDRNNNSPRADIARSRLKETPVRPAHALLVCSSCSQGECVRLGAQDATLCARRRPAWQGAAPIFVALSPGPVLLPGRRRRAAGSWAALGQCKRVPNLLVDHKRCTWRPSWGPCRAGLCQWR